MLFVASPQLAYILLVHVLVADKLTFVESIAIQPLTDKVYVPSSEELKVYELAEILTLASYDRVNLEQLPLPEVLPGVTRDVT